VILDDAVMPNVVTAPQNDVTTNFDERLNGIVFKDESVVTTLESRKDRSLRTNIADKFVAAALGVIVFLSPNVVHFLKAHRNEHLEFGRRITLMYFLEGNNRQTLVFDAFDVVTIQRESHHLVRRVMG